MIEVRFLIDAGLSEQLEDYFCEEYQEHWSIEENRLTHEHFLRGFFEDQETLSSQAASLQALFPALPTNPSISDLPDRDWKEAYKLHFKPWSERGLHWVPLWEKDTYALPEGEEIVLLDPGMAFGTGNHETTRLCVRRLLDARDEWGSVIPRKRVIDAGCGSGILAISAAKIGFADIYGFDYDPDSVRISFENEILCDLKGTIQFECADLNQGLIGQSADLLLANILANVLCDHAELLCQSVRPGGWLVLSGILAKEVEAVHAVFVPVIAGITGTRPDMDARIDGEWADLCYRF
jgi:ribosomal protein L11 methyltransferase